MEEKAKTLGQFEAAAAAFAKKLSPLPEGATLVTLTGVLGAGKTAFVKAVAGALGVEEIVTSPTFVLEKIYALPEGAPFTRLVHIDAYRLESPEELAALGFDELMRARDTLVLLEWPERVERALPPPAHRIALALAEGGERTISYG